ncbi:LOW QUALITY PROTEIN: zinc finger MYM-type protein 6-like [Rhagoletis pomonella]|uniref:LOW QUALITY PROTEIN: zinc finger MYM-type protein 6-like n=1 Tax=Rhagoletis pomonella TaxID=28610 RepID=UPI0017801DEC|nr:LOW QUALITY PROTEIN: zinc finger MYM-type protein 6-like [Rhagoletis pomonella]
MIANATNTGNNNIPPDLNTYTNTGSKKFLHAWLDQFPWLQNVNGASHCMACDKKLSNHVTDLKKHGSLAVHLQNVKNKKKQIQIQKFLSSEEITLSGQVKYAELTLVMFLICHNLPFLLMDFLPALLKDCCPDSKIAAAIQCGRTKSTEIADILGNKAKNKIVRKLKSSKFSLIVDETTDLSTKTCLVLVVRYFDKLTQRVYDSVLSLIELKNCDASSIYDAIKQFFCEQGIPLKNIIGLATDGANVMAGQLNGLRAKLKPDTDFFYIKCTCHSLHLCSAYASKQLTLPHKIEELCRNIFSL